MSNGTEFTHNERMLISALESVNAEYIILRASEEYQLGHALITMKSLLLQGSLLEIMGRIRKRLQFTHRKESDKGAKTIGNTTTPLSLPDDGLKKVVYGCITNGYDVPETPFYYTPSVDYVMFTDNVSQTEGSGWLTRSLDDLSLPKEASLNPNRYCKMHPWELFNDYDMALYVDGNVTIVSEVATMFTAALESNAGVALHTHSARSTIAEEANACISLGKGNAKQCTSQVYKYRKLGFQDNVGLWEATVVGFDLHNPVARLLMDTWWDFFIESESERDQLSLPFAIWALGLSGEDIGMLGNDVTKNPKLRCGSHLL